jgi:hypothetical protein
MYSTFAQETSVKKTILLILRMAGHNHFQAGSTPVLSLKALIGLARHGLVFRSHRFVPGLSG